jgi:hypothetical protein
MALHGLMLPMMTYKEYKSSDSEIDHFKIIETTEKPLVFIMLREINFQYLILKNFHHACYII